MSIVVLYNGGIMKPLETVGNILGYIPGVSTFVGLIKGFVYLSKAKACEKERAAMAVTADKIDKLIVPKVVIADWDGGWYLTNKLVEVPTEKAREYRKLAQSSFLQMIPLVNVGFAITESFALRNLNIAREHENPKKIVEELVQRYSVKLPEKAGREREFCLSVLTILDNLNLKNELQIGIKREIYSNSYQEWKKNPLADPIQNVKKGLQDKLDELKKVKIRKPPELAPGLDSDNQHRNVMRDATNEYNRYQQLTSSLEEAIKTLEEAERNKRAF